MTVTKGPPPNLLLTEPIPRALIKLALPVFASHLLRLSFQWVDALWVRGLGVDATAAITTSIFATWWVLSLNDIVGIGVMAYISQLLGAGQRQRAGVAAWKAIRASAVLGLFGTAAGLFAGHRVFAIMTSDPRMIETGGRYLSIILAAAPLPMMALTCESVMRACGNTRTPLLLDLGAVGLNAILAPFLIYGIGPFPRLEVAGAAWATVIAQLVLVISYLTLAMRGHPQFPLARRAEGPPIRIIGMAKVGLPAALIGSMFSVVYIAFARAASQFGPAAMAVVGVVNRIEAIQFMTAVAIGMAGATLVGQSLGAGRPDRAEQVIRTGLKWAAGFGAVMSVLLAAIPEVFLRLFSNDPEVIRQGVPYMRVMALALIPNAMEIVTVESIIGSGHTRTMSIIFNVFSIARIPLAFLVPGWTGTGVVGIAWVITLTCIVRGVLIVAWGMRGTWKRGLAHELHGAPVPAPETPDVAGTAPQPGDVALDPASARGASDR